MKKYLDIIHKDSNYSLSIFEKADWSAQKRNYCQRSKPYVTCVIRDTKVIFKSEEVVRQLYAMTLLSKYGYPQQRIKLSIQSILAARWKIGRYCGFWPRSPDRWIHGLLKLRNPNPKTKNSFDLTPTPPVRRLLFGPMAGKSVTTIKKRSELFPRYYRYSQSRSDAGRYSKRTVYAQRSNRYR